MKIRPKPAQPACGTQLGQGWFEIYDDQVSKRDRSHVYQNESAEKAARKAKWARKKARKGRK